MKFGARAGEDSVVKVKVLIKDLGKRAGEGFGGDEPEPYCDEERAEATAPVFEFNDKWLQIKGVNMTFVCGARAILSLARCQFQDYSQHVEYIRDLG